MFKVLIKYNFDIDSNYITRLVYFAAIFKMSDFINCYFEDKYYLLRARKFSLQTSFSLTNLKRNIKTRNII
jgi:hypothetical protein